MPSPRASRSRTAETSKAAILAAARQRFARDGYDRATVRAIAADAEIDPAMVIRYFGSKEKLFAEAADFDLRLPDLSAVPRSRVGAVFVEHFLERWEADDTFMALIRTAATNEAAAKRVRSVLASQVAPMVARVCAEPVEASARSTLVASQLLGFALCRYVLRLTPALALGRAEVVAWLAPTVQRYLTGPRPSDR
ncbi:MAG: TetR family transcriptional regulator [Deltaproteobacteria bacterium]|nr:TetR family transcriptional regulator [Deltaproteobacteria bacterium]